MKEQYYAKDDELKRTKDLLNNTEKMLADLQTLIESTGEEPEKQKKQLDNIMKGLQVGMQDDIEQFKNTVRELEEKLKNANDENNLMRSELAAITSGDENELSKIIMELRNELDKVKKTKDTENDALKDAFSKQENELKALKNVLNQQNKEQMPLPESHQDYSNLDIDRLKDMLDEKDKSIKLLTDQLKNEKNQNNALKEDLNLLANNDENGLKQKILALTTELENVKSKPSEDAFQSEERSKPETLLAATESVGDKIRDLENLLKLEKELTDGLKKEIADEKDKYNKLASADDNELKRMLVDAERKIEELNQEKENNKPPIKSLESEGTIPPTSPDSKEGVIKIPDDYEQLKKENIELKDENNKLQIKLNELQEREIPTNIDNLLKENENLKSENRALKHNNGILKGTKKDQDSIAEKLEFPDTSGPFPLEESRDIEKDELINENNELKNELERLKKGLLLPSQTEKKSEAKGEMGEDEDMKKKLSQFENENEKLKLLLKEEKDKYNESITEKDQIIKALQDKLNQMQKENIIPQAEKQSDRRQLGSDSTDIEDLKKKISQLESQNTELKKEKDSWNENSKSLNDNIKTLQEENKKLEEMANKLKDSSKKVPSTPSKAEDFLPDQELKQCIQDKQNLEQELDKLKQMLDYNQAQEEQTKVPVNKSQEVRDNELLKDNEVSLLKDENKKVNAANERLKEDLDQLKQELEELKKKDQKPVPETVLEKEAKIPEDISKKLKEENSKLKSKVKELEDTISKMQSLPEVQTKATQKGQTDESDLNDPQSLTKERNDNLKLVKENESLRNEISSLKKQLTEAQEKVLELGKENEKYLDLLNNAKRSGGIADDSLLSICQNNLEKLKKENLDLKERIAALEKDLKQAKTIGLTPDDSRSGLEGASQRAQGENSDKPLSSKTEILKEQPSTPKKGVEVSKRSSMEKRGTPIGTFDEANDDYGGLKTSDKEKDIHKQKIPIKSDVDTSENPLKFKKETPKGESPTKREIERVQTPEKGISKDQLGKTKDGIDKNREEQPTMKIEVGSIKPTDKGTPKDQPAKTKDAVGKKREKRDVESIKPTDKVTPKEQPVKANDVVDKNIEERLLKQKEVDSVKPTEKVIPKGQPVKAKDVIDKTRERGLSKTPDSHALSTEEKSKPIFKENIQGKKEIKPDAENLAMKIKPHEKEPFIGKEDISKRTLETPATKDGKILSGKEISEPKEKGKRPREEMKSDRQYVGDDDTVMLLPENVSKTEKKDSNTFPKKATSPKYERKIPGSDEEKDISEASSKHFEERKNPDFDLLQKRPPSSADKQVLSGEKAKGKQQIKEKAKSRLARGVGEGVDLDSGKEKAQKRKRAVIEERKGQDFDEDQEEEPKYKPATKDIKAKKDKVAGKVEDSSKTHEPDLFDTEKPLDITNKGYGDKELANESNELRKKLYEAEKLIKHLQNENVTLNMQIENLRKVQTPREGKLS